MCIGEIVGWRMDEVGLMSMRGEKKRGGNVGMLRLKEKFRSPSGVCPLLIRGAATMTEGLQPSPP